MFVKNCNLLFTSVKARNIITVHTRNQFIPAVPYPFIQGIPQTHVFLKPHDH